MNFFNIQSYWVKFGYQDWCWWVGVVVMDHFELIFFSQSVS